jgi:hypothetical protein
MMEAVIEFLGALPWFAWIAIVAIGGGTVRSVVKANHHHQQRMELIRQGLDPSLIDEKSESD